MVISAKLAATLIHEDDACVVGTCYIDGAGTYATLNNYTKWRTDHVWLCYRDARDEYPPVHCTAANGDVTIVPSPLIEAEIFTAVERGMK